MPNCCKCGRKESPKITPQECPVYQTIITEAKKLRKTSNICIIFHVREIDWIWSVTNNLTGDKDYGIVNNIEEIAEIIVKWAYE